METVDGRVLPTLGKKKEPSWQAYGHPFEPEPLKVRVSLVIRDLGLSRSSTLAAISQLPAVVSLAFSPYTRGLDEWAWPEGADMKRSCRFLWNPWSFPRQIQAR